MNQQEANRLVLNVAAALMQDRQSDWLIQDEDGNPYDEATLSLIERAKARLVEDLRRRADRIRD